MFKLLKITLLISLAIINAGCDTVDLTGIEGEIKDIQNDIYSMDARIDALESYCDDNYSQIQALQSLIANMDYITNVSPIGNNGYRISFANRAAITIMNGKDASGVNMPTISCKKDFDELYYWTISYDRGASTDWLLDDSGNKILVVNSTTTLVAPEIGIKEYNGVLYWQVDGEWLLCDGEMVPAKGQDGTDGADGLNGQDGKDGADGLNGQDGKDGADGLNGQDGKDGADGLNGQDGKDGVSNSIFEDVEIKNGIVVFTLEGGEQIKVHLYIDDNKVDGASLELATMPSDGASIIGDTWVIVDSLYPPYSACISLVSAITTAGRDIKIELPNMKGIPTSLFMGKTNITEVIAPQANAIDYTAFYGCTSLVVIDAPQVETIGNNAFNGCISLTSVNLPNVKTIGSSAFSGCVSLEVINLPLLTSLDMCLFQDCKVLKEVYTPAAVSVGYYVFKGCTELNVLEYARQSNAESAVFTNLVIDEDVIGNVTLYTSYGYNCENNIWYLGDAKYGSFKAIVGAIDNISAAEFSLATIPEDGSTIEGGVWVITDSGRPLTPDFARLNKAIRSAEREIMLEFPNILYIPDEALNINNDYSNQVKYVSKIIAPNAIYIGDEAFAYCTALDGVVFDNVKTIGMDVFTSCTALKSVYMPELTAIPERTFMALIALEETNLSKVTEIGSSAFVNCTSLKEVNMPNVNILGATAFMNSGIESINFPLLRSLETSVFMMCSKLKHIDMPLVETLSANVFFSCSGLESVNMPALTSIGASCFESCTNLKEVNMPNLTTIDNRAFKCCNSLSNVYIPKLNTIGEYSFYDCDMLSSLYLPEANFIKKSAFAECDVLQTVTMLDIMAIEEDIFAGCYSLQKVYIDVRITPNVDSYAFRDLETKYVTLTINYGSSSNNYWVHDSSGERYGQFYSVIIE